MKCKLCGAVYDDENLYFCISCGAMLKNPATGEIVKENRADEILEAAKEIPVEEIEKVSEAEDILPQPAEIFPEVAESDESTPMADKKEEIIFSSEPMGEKSPVADKIFTSVEKEVPAEKTHSDELLIEKECEKAVPPPVNNIPNGTENAPVKKAPVKVGFERLLGGFLVALLSGILLFAVILLFSLKLGFTGTNLHNIAENLDKWAVINAEFDGLSVSDHLYYETDFSKATHGSADKTEFALFLAGTDFTGFCADKLEQYADYIIDGAGDEPTLTDSDIVDFFRKHHDRGVEIFGYDMQTADYNSIRSSLTANETAEKFSVSKIGWEIKFRLENIRYMLSYTTIGILTALAIVLMIWVGVVLKGRKRIVLGYIGNIFTWSGIAILLTAAAASAGAALGYTITGSFLCYLSSTLLLPSAIYAACIGVLLLITGVIIIKIKNSIKIKEKIQKASAKTN